MQTNKLEFISDESLKKFSEQLVASIHDQKKLIIVIGQLGSGKTTNVLKALDDSDQSSVSCITFSAAHSIEEALLKSISPLFRMVLAITLFCIFFIAMPVLLRFIIPASVLSFIVKHALFKPGELYLALGGFLTVAVLLNKLNLLFKCAWFLHARKIVVLDDLERSSLSLPEIFHVVRQFEKTRVKHVIANIGFSSSDQKFEILEFAYKVGASIEELPISEKVNICLAKKLDDNFPFREDPPPLFLSMFSPRELFEIIERGKKRSVPFKDIKASKGVFLHMMLHALFEKLEYRAEELNNLSLSDPNSGRIRFAEHNHSKGFQIPQIHKIVLDSFSTSIEGLEKPNQEFTNSFARLLNPRASSSELRSHSQFIFK